MDNASTDRSREIASDRGCRVFRSERNIGFGAACNLGAREAKGRFLVFVNPDAFVQAGWLDPLLRPIADAPGLSTARITLADAPDTIDTAGNVVHVSGITTCRGHGRPIAYYGRDDRVLAVSGACFAIDRISFEALGGFDEGYFMYLEDTDLSLRAALRGLPIHYVAGSNVRHRHTPSFGPGKIFWLERNRLRMALKLWSTSTLVALLAHFAIVELLTWCYAATKGFEGLGAKARAYGWLIRHASNISRERRATQATRRVDDRDLLARAAWRLDLTELVTDSRARALASALSRPVFALGQAWLKLILR